MSEMVIMKEIEALIKDLDLVLVKKKTKNIPR